MVQGDIMKTWIAAGLVLAMALPVYAQKKEEERVENAGTVMKEENGVLQP